ncbi:hypothetical protein CG723_45465 [Streptomyces sp. CB01635]|nr:hypothetical protein CG723_45465 [Streptomyces sp. CB01635]
MRRRRSLSSRSQAASVRSSITLAGCPDRSPDSSECTRWRGSPPRPPLTHHQLTTFAMTPLTRPDSETLLEYWGVSFGSSDRWSDVSLADAQWARIEPLLPDRTPKRGGRWRDHRQVIDAITWKFRTGSPRDSKRPASAQLALSVDAWRQFTEFAAR